MGRIRRAGVPVLLAWSLGGCGGFVRPPDLRPPLHPLLEAPTRLGGPRPATSDGPVVGSDADPDLAVGRRALVRRALEALIGADRIAGRPAGDLALVRAAFADARLDSAPERITDIDALWRRARPRRGPVRPADLVFFAGPDYGPRVGVVTRVFRDGVLEAAFVTRGAVRRIRVDPRRPDARRSGSRIVNTFIRAKRREDPPRTPHLAGQLLAGIRTLLD